MSTNTLFVSLERIENLLRIDFGRGPRARSHQTDYKSVWEIVERVDELSSKASPEELVALGRKLYGLLNANNLFAEALDAFPAGEVIALAIEAAPELRRIPWETLHDGFQFLVEQRGKPVIPVRVLKTRTDLSPKEPANRALRVLYMAASPEGIEPIFGFEREEGDILEASRETDSSFELVVEESGALAELKKNIVQASRGAFDIVHLSGHTGVRDGNPVFLLENDFGEVDFTDGIRLDDALDRKPRLVFLSGCRTAEETGAGSIRTLAEQILEGGTESVLGWARPVSDGIAIAAARAMYASLAIGDELPKALSKTFQSIFREEEALRKKYPDERIGSSWHQLRLFVREVVPGAYVTPLNTDDREGPRTESFSDQFLTPLTDEIKAISREKFVGRRRLLQGALKVLKGKEKVGVVLHGLGGNGKTCVAARLCDRLNQIGSRLEPVVLVGRVKESDLVGKFSDKLSSYKELRDILADSTNSGDSLRYRLLNVLTRSTVSFLFVLDDFERNYSDGPGGDAQDSNGKFKLSGDTRAVLAALVDAVWESRNKRRHRIILTSRFRLEGTEAQRFHQHPVNGFQGFDLEKLLKGLRSELEQKKAGGLPFQESELQAFEASAIEIAGGNARLLRWLFELFLVMKNELPEIFEKMMLEEREELLEDILAREIISRQTEANQKFLGIAAVFNHFAPLSVIRELALEMIGVEGDFDACVGVGLLEKELDDPSEPVFQVPRVIRQLLIPFATGDEEKCHARAAELLYDRWWGVEARIKIPLADELVRLSSKGNRPKITAQVEDYIQRWLMHHYRFKEAQARLSHLPLEALGEFPLQMALGRIAEHFGEGDKAERHYEAALQKCEDTENRGFLLYYRANLLAQGGKLDAALDCFQNELLPLYDKLGNVRNRAATLAQVADILFTRGDLDRAISILQEDVLPVFEKLGDQGSRALTLCKIVDIQFERGDLDEAWRILHGVALPIFDKLGNARNRAVALCRVADILKVRGDLNGAVQILLREALPVFDKLGDVQNRSITLGKVADILQVRGDLDQALRIRLEEELPVFDKLGDVRERAVTLGKVVDFLEMRGDLEEALRILQREILPAFAKLGDERNRAITLGKVADILKVRGELDQALRIRQEEELPVFEKLGDVRERARTLGNIAGIFFERGDLDGAFRILTGEVIPAFDRLGDVQGRAIALGQVAHIQIKLGKLDDAIILVKESLAIREKLGDVRGKAVMLGVVAHILFKRGDFDEALRIRKEEELPIYEKLGDVRFRAATLGQVADILLAQGDPDGALRLLQGEVLPVFDRLGEVKGRAVTLLQISRIFSNSGRFDESLAMISEAMAIFEKLQSPLLEIAQRKYLDVLLKITSSEHQYSSEGTETGLTKEKGPAIQYSTVPGQVERGWNFTTSSHFDGGQTRSKDFEVCRVFFATNRDRDIGALKPFEVFLPSGKMDRVSYGWCEVSIPANHKKGKLESPSVIRRFLIGENPKQHIVLLSVNGRDERDFFTTLRKCVSDSIDKSAFVFIHGYNVTFEDAARRTAQIHYDLRFPGAPIFFSWPSQGNPALYTQDEERIQESRDHFRQFLADVSAKTGVERLFLIAHSMGNRALTEAFIDLIREETPVIGVVREIILAAPDIGTQVFLTRIAPAMVGAGCPITLYASSNDKALMLSNGIHGGPRVGDTGDNIVVHQGIETIDATEVNTSFLGHSPFAEERTVLSDMFSLIRNGQRANKRDLNRIDTVVGSYWKIPG